MTSNSLRGFLDKYQDKLPGAVLENYREREMDGDAELLVALKKTIKFGRTRKLMNTLRIPGLVQFQVIKAQVWLYDRGWLRLK